MCLHRRRRSVVMHHGLIPIYTVFYSFDALHSLTNTEPERRYKTSHHLSRCLVIASHSIWYKTPISGTHSHTYQLCSVQRFDAGKLRLHYILRVNKKYFVLILYHSEMMDFLDVNCMIQKGIQLWILKNGLLVIQILIR